MRIDNYVDDIIYNDGVLEFSEKEIIADDILDKVKSLPLKKGFTKEQLLSFNDKSLILYLSDVYELYTIGYFQQVGRDII